MEQNDTTQEPRYTQGTVGPHPEAGPDRSTAIFVLGICSLIGVLVIPVAGWLVGLICGIVGLVFANRARQAQTLDGLGQAGFVLSIIGTALSGLLVLFVLIALGFGLSMLHSVVGPASTLFWF